MLSYDLIYRLIGIMELFAVPDVSGSVRNMDNVLFCYLFFSLLLLLLLFFFFPFFLFVVLNLLYFINY